jgi:hypothetical protein
MAWLWKSTMAKASEMTGADWHDLIEAGRARQAGSQGDQDPDGGSHGDGDGGTDGDGAGSDASARRRGRRRRLLGAVGCSLLLVPLFVTLVVGSDDTPAPAADTTPTQPVEAAAAAVTPAAVTGSTKRSGRHKRGAGAVVGNRLVIVSKTGTVTTVPVSSPVARRYLATHPTTPRTKVKGTGGTGHAGTGPKVKLPVTGASGTPVTPPSGTVDTPAADPGTGSTPPPTTTSTPPPTTTSTPPPTTTSTPPPTTSTTTPPPKDPCPRGCDGSGPPPIG